MHRYLPELAAQPVPRYTSYPTAAEFGESVGAAEQARALAAIAPDTPVSLYVHVPYCHSICWYCGCNTGAAGSGARLSAYVDAVIAEAATVSARMRGRIASVHFGGGSPNALAPGDFTRLAEALRGLFGIDRAAYWAVELDPRALGLRFVDALAAAGVRRASLGAQTFSRAIQARIQRVQPFAQVASAARMLRSAGIDRLNLDLMYGLPGQGLDDIASTIAAARTLAPDRVAMFGYAHMPSLLPRQRMIDAAALPGPAERFWQSALAHDLLVEAGYRAVGFDHFALPGDSLARAAQNRALRRNFQGFTDDSSEVLVGLGASAISRLGGQGEGLGDGLLVQNEKHVGRYRLRAVNGALAGVRGVVRGAEDGLRGAIIERLLCDGEVDVAEICARHGVSPHRFDAVLAGIDGLAATGIAVRDGRRVAITPEGRPYARLVAARFDAFRAGPPQRFAQAV